MKQLFFKQPSPKYKNLEFNELKQVLFQTNSSRNKVPILINLVLLNENKELYKLLLNEVKNIDNIVKNHKQNLESNNKFGLEVTNFNLFQILYLYP